MAITLNQPCSPKHKGTYHTRVLPKVPKVLRKENRRITNTESKDGRGALLPPSKHDARVASRSLPRVPILEQINCLPNSKTNDHVINLAVPTVPKIHRVLPTVPKREPDKGDKENENVRAHNVSPLSNGDGSGCAVTTQKTYGDYNASFKITQDDRVTCLARSKCQDICGKKTKAIQDVKWAPTIDPSCHESLYQKAELYFQQGDYDMALVYYSKGLQTRPDIRAFQQGIEKTRDALNKSTAGKTKGFVKAPGISLVHTKQKNERKPSTVRTFTREAEQRDITSPGFRLRLKNPLVKIEQGPHGPEDDDYAVEWDKTGGDMTEARMKRILGRMYSDKKYLEKLIEQAGDIKSVDLHSMAENGLDFLYDRVLYWVRQGRIIPPEAPILPLPSETTNIAGHLPRVSSPASGILLKGIHKDKDASQPNKGQSQSWFRYLERKKTAEVNTKKVMNHKFIHVLEGRKLSLREQENKNLLNPIKPHVLGKDTRKEDGRRRNKKCRERDISHSDTDSGLNISFSTYRQPSDLCFDSADDIMDLGLILGGTSKKKNAQNKKLAKKPKGSRDVSKREQILQYISKEIEEIEYAYVMGLYAECMRRAEACLNTVSSYSESKIPDILSIVAKLHSYIGNAAIEMGDYSTALAHHEKDLYIGEESDDDEALSRALGNLGRIYVFRNKHQRALELFSRKVPLCKTRLETSWLYHEIGNCFLIQGQYQFAMEAALRSLRAAEETLEWSYQLQSLVLLGVAEVKLKKFSNAVKTFERARDQARLQGDIKAEDAITEALNDVNKRICEELKALRGGDTSRSEKGRLRSKSARTRSRAEWSDYSSIFIPEDDGDISLTETGYDTDNLHLDLDQLRSDIETSMYGSQVYLHSERLLSSRLPVEVRRSLLNLHSTARQPSLASTVTNIRDSTVVM